MPSSTSLHFSNHSVLKGSPFESLLELIQTPEYSNYKRSNFPTLQRLERSPPSSIIHSGRQNKPAEPSFPHALSMHTRGKSKAFARGRKGRSHAVPHNSQLPTPLNSKPKSPPDPKMVHNPYQRQNNLLDARQDGTLDSQASMLKHYDGVQQMNEEMTLQDIKEYVVDNIGDGSMDTPEHLLDSRDVLAKIYLTVTEYIKSVCFQSYKNPAPPGFRANKTPRSFVTYTGAVIAHINDEILAKFSRVKNLRIFNEISGDRSISNVRDYIINHLSRTVQDGTNSNARTDLHKLPILRDKAAHEYLLQNATGEMVTVASEPDEVTVDLKHINNGLIKTGDYWALLSSNLNWNSVGRANEPTFLSYNKMQWNEHYNCVVAMWFQSKTLTTTPTTWTPDRHNYQTCVMFSLALIWLMKDGINRTIGNGERRNNYKLNDALLLFPRGKAKDGHLTNAIRKTVPEERRGSMDATCIRSGAATALANSNDVTFDESIARGGWSSGTNRDNYVQWVIKTVVVGMLCLAGYPDNRMHPVCPRLDCLPTPLRQKMELYIQSLYRNKLDEFKPHGRLYNMAKAVHATLLMRFSDFLRDHGNEHQVVVHMVSRLSDRDANFLAPGEDALCVLCHAGSIIKDDFELQIKQSLERRFVESPLHAKFREIQAEMSRQAVERESTESALRNVISQFHDTVKVLQEKLEEFSNRRDTSSESVMQSTSPTRAHGVSPSPNDGSPSSLTENGATPANDSSQSAPDSGSLPRQLHPFFSIPRDSRGRQLVPGQQTITGMARAARPVENQTLRAPGRYNYVEVLRDDTLSQILEKEYQHGQFENCWPFPSIKTVNGVSYFGNNQVPDSTKYRIALHLAFLLLLPEQRMRLVSKEPMWKEEDRAPAFKAVDERYYAMRAMLDGSPANCRVKPCHQGVANYVSGKSVVPKLEKYNLFSSYDPADPTACLTGHSPDLAIDCDNYAKDNTVRMP